MERTTHPTLYVVLSNQSSKQNLGTYLRTASAFGATQVIVVGSAKFGTHGAHRAHKYVDIVHFYKFTDAAAYLRSKNCEIIGIKHCDTSFVAQSAPYERSCAFVIDNEVPGLSEDQMAICDRFVHVPFHTTHAPHPALETTVVMAIVLHQFTKWAKFPVRSMQDTTTQGKFVLDADPTRSLLERDGARKAAERQEKRANAYDGLDEDEEGGLSGFLFD